MMNTLDSLKTAKAFTLIETVVVMVVTALLAAAALVGYPTITGSLADGRAKALLQSIVAAETAHLLSRGAFVGDTLDTVETGISANAEKIHKLVVDIDHVYMPAHELTADEVGAVAVAAYQDGAGRQVLIAVTRSASGTCFHVAAYAPSAHTPQVEGEQPSGAACTAKGAYTTLTTTPAGAVASN